MRHQKEAHTTVATGNVSDNCLMTASMAHSSATPSTAMPMGPMPGAGCSSALGTEAAMALLTRRVANSQPPPLQGSHARPIFPACPN